MPFDPNQPFSVEGDTAVTDAPKGFDPSKPFTLEDAPVDPITKGQQYLDAVNSGQAPLADTPESHYAAAKEYFDGDALAQTATGAGRGIKNFFVDPKKSLGGIGTALGEWDRRATAEVDREAKEHPFTGIPRLAFSAASGLAGGAVNLANQGINFLDDAGNYGTQLLGRATGDADPGKSRAYADFYQRQNNAKLGAATDKAKEAVPSPAMFTLGENAAPFLAPVPSLGLAGPIAKIGKGLGEGIESAILSPAGGALQTVVSHAAGGGHGVGGIIKRGIVAPIVKGVAPKVGGLAEQLTDAGLNTTAAGATNLGFSLAGSPAGSAEQNAESALANTALFSPVSILHGGYARQNLNEATLAKQAAVRGMVEYGNNPSLDAATARGIANLTPEQQKAIFEQRGLFRDIKNPEGKQIQIHVPDDYAERAAAVNAGTVADATNSRGFYLDGQGGVYLNPDTPANLGAALKEAIGHETGHSVYQDALPAVNERAASRLRNAVANEALDANLQPTPKFQSFIDQYAQAAGGKPGATVDWNSLPVSGEGLTRNYLLNELGAETVRAATPEVGKQLAGREASDVISDIGGDLATRLGIRDAPSASAILGPDGTPVPIGVSALQAARTGTYAVGKQAREGFASPVRIAEADKVATPKQSPQASDSRSQIQPSTLETGTSAQPDTSFRETPAYQNALIFATANKKVGGLGLSATDATAKLDAAALHADVPNTTEDYVRFAQTGKPPRQVPVIAPKPVPASPAASTESLAPTSSFTPPLNPNIPTVSPQAKRIHFLMGGPGGAKRIELPKPVLTLPPAEPIKPVEPINRFAGMDESPVAGPTDQRAISLSQEGDSQAPNQTLDATASGGVLGEESQPIRPVSISASETSSPNPNPDTSTEASPLSSEDIARIEAETQKNHDYSDVKKPNAKTLAENPNALEERRAASLAKAKADAVAKAHGEALPEGDTRVQRRVDLETGRTSFSGTHLVEGDALHDPILAGLSDRDKSQLSSIQSAIQSGDALNVDYHSAPELEVGSATTSTKRQAAQAVSTGAQRAIGEAPSVLQKGKEYFPQSVSSSNGNVYVHGVNIDKFIANANKAIDLFNQEGRATPYQDVNSPEFIQDVQGYFRNHANSVSGDGTIQLKGTKDIPVRPTPEGYEPYQLSKDKADFINLALGQEGAKTPSRGSKVPSERIQAFARANGIEPTEAGEVNSLRQSVNDAGNFQVGDATGTKKVLEDPMHETIRLDNIQDLRPSQGNVADPSNLRAQGFRGARGDLTKDGLPSARASAAGFLVGNGNIAPRSDISYRYDATSNSFVPVTPPQQSKQDDD